MTYRRKCLDCRGTGEGKTADDECPSCRGYGYITEDDEDPDETIKEGDYHLYQPPGRIQEKQELPAVDLTKSPPGPPSPPRPAKWNEVA